MAKAASPRSILALAALAALLVLSGCGGGSGSGTTTPSASTQQQSSSGPQDPAPKPQQGNSSSSSSSQKKAADTAQAPPGAASQGAAKHGRHIALPKGKPEPSPTPKELAQATVADMTLTSPSLPPPTGGATSLPASYTCDGKGIWPALQWQGVPTGTAELALLVMNAQPVQGKLFFDWALAGIDPSLTAIEAGRLPKGAIAGQNSFGKDGYEICPPQGETYIFALYALPDPLKAKQGFDPHALREAILAQSGNVGLMAASYVRG